MNGLVRLLRCWPRGSGIPDTVLMNAKQDRRKKVAICIFNILVKRVTRDKANDRAMSRSSRWFSNGRKQQT